MLLRLDGLPKLRLREQRLDVRAELGASTRLEFATHPCARDGSCRCRRWWCPPAPAPPPPAARAWRAAAPPSPRLQRRAAPPAGAARLPVRPRHQLAPEVPLPEVVRGGRCVRRRCRRWCRRSPTPTHRWRRCCSLAPPCPLTGTSTGLVPPVDGGDPAPPSRHSTVNRQSSAVRLQCRRRAHRDVRNRYRKGGGSAGPSPQAESPIKAATAQAVEVCRIAIQVQLQGLGREPDSRQGLVTSDSVPGAKV